MIRFTKYSQLGRVITFASFFVAVVAFAGATQVSASRFYFNPASGQFTQTCESYVDIYVDTQGTASNAADLRVTFNPAQVQVIDQDAEAGGVQLEINPGVSYEGYVINDANNSSGVIRMAASSYFANFNGNAMFARLHFRSVGGTASASFSIDFTGSGSTHDSNIANATSSQDTLTSVGNGSYTFVTGSCTPDTTVPTIVFVSPQDGDSGIAANAPVEIQISDADSGVDINSIEVIINGETFANGDPGVTITGTAAAYTVTIAGGAHAPFPSGAASSIQVNAEDLLGNAISDLITFNNVISNDTTRPTVVFVTPNDLDPNFDTSQPIQFTITDDGSGVNIYSMEIYYNNHLFTANSGEVSFTQAGNTYTVTLTNYAAVGGASLESLLVIVEDNAGNQRIAHLGLADCEPVETPPDEVTPVTDGSITCIIPDFQLPDTGIIRDFVGEAGTSGTLAALTFISFIVSLLPWLNVVNLPTVALNFIGVLFARKKKTSYGLVYDASSLKPVGLATVRVFTSGTTNLINQTISGMNGKFGVLLTRGSYRLEVVHPDYQKFQTEFRIEQDGTNLSINVPLAKGNVVAVKQKNRYLEGFLKYFRDMAKNLYIRS